MAFLLPVPLFCLVVHFRHASFLFLRAFFVPTRFVDSLGNCPLEVGSACSGLSSFSLGIWRRCVCLFVFFFVLCVVFGFPCVCVCVCARARVVAVSRPFLIVSGTGALARPSPKGTQKPLEGSRLGQWQLQVWLFWFPVFVCGGAGDQCLFGTYFAQLLVTVFVLSGRCFLRQQRSEKSACPSNFCTQNLVFPPPPPPKGPKMRKNCTNQ